MKKNYSFVIIFFMLILKGISQPTFFTEAPVYDNSTSTGRGPNGTSSHVYMRACGLVKATELTNIAVNSTITSFGYTLNSGAAGTAPVGNYTLYLQNTSDVTYNKGTSFSGAIVGMTQVYANTMTIPISAGSTSVVVTLSTPFVYTGGGIYVAYSWYCPGPYSSSAAVYRCNSGGLSPGLASGASTTAAPDALGTTAFRPCFLFGVANTYTNEIGVTGIEAPGRLSGLQGTSHIIKAIVRNNSNVAKTNIPVSLNVSGANTFTDLQTISSLASGATTTVSFAAFAPVQNGLNTLSVSVPSDEINSNNSVTYTQSVTCNEWALNPANVSYTMGAVGFNTGSGIIACSYTNTNAATLIGLRGSISTNTPAVGNNTWGVLLSSTGSVIATTNTIAITSTVLGTFQTFTFTTPPVLNAGTAYYFGFAQPANTLGYFPMGTYTTAYVPYINYVTTTTVGGTPAPLTSNLGYFGMEAIFQPTLSLSANSSTVVCGSTAVLSASTPGTYTWSAGPANSNYSVVPVANTVYTVDASNFYGCTNSATAMVTVNPLTVTAISNTATICAGNTISLTAGGASTYTWSSGPSVNASTFTDTPAASLVYTVQGGNAAGCSGSATVSVTVNTFTSLGVSVAGVSVCPGGSISVTASGANTYTWNTGSTTFNTAAISLLPSSSAIYTVSGTDANGCVDTENVGITVYSNPTITATASSGTVMCVNATNTLTATGATTYSWSNGATSSSVVATSSVVGTLAYTITGVNSTSCSSSTTISLQVDACTGIAELNSTNAVSVYPNPFSGSVNLTFENEISGEVTVTNILGSVILQEPVSGRTHTLNLQDQVNGIYFVTILNNGKSFGTTKLIKH